MIFAKAKWLKQLASESPKGLTAVLSGELDVPEALHALEPNLWVLPAGDVLPNPVAMLASKEMEILLERVAARFEFVIIDSPPVLAVTDAAILSRPSRRCFIGSGERHHPARWTCAHAENSGSIRCPDIGYGSEQAGSTPPRLRVFLLEVRLEMIRILFRTYSAGLRHCHVLEKPTCKVTQQQS